MAESLGHKDMYGCLLTQPNNIEKIIDTAMQVMNAANQQLSVQHPVLEYNNHIYVATIVDSSENPKAHYQNVHVFSTRQFDHSPGGTGTSARMAILYAKGQLKLKEEIWAESISGGLFRGRLLNETKLGNKKAVVPEIGWVLILPLMPKISFTHRRYQIYYLNIKSVNYLKITLSYPKSSRQILLSHLIGENFIIFPCWTNVFVKSWNP